MDQQFKQDLVRQIVENYQSTSSIEIGVVVDDTYATQLLLDLNSDLNQFLTKHQTHLSFETLSHLFQLALPMPTLRLIQQIVAKRNTIDRTIFNRRLKYIDTILHQQSYFSIENIKAREPNLYQSIYETKIESLESFPEDMGLVDRIYYNLDRNELSKRDKQITEDDDAFQEFEEEEEEEEEEEQEEDIQVHEDFPEDGATVDELELEVELIRLAKELFLAGKDLEFDYSQVDNNEEYDDIQVIENQLLESYFDQDDLDTNGNNNNSEYTGIQDY